MAAIPAAALVAMSKAALARTAAAIAVAVAAPAASIAQPLGKEDYQGARKTIESDFRTARLGCEPMPGNVKAVCVADVRGREAIALAELVAAYQPTDETRMEVRIVKARAGLSLARARCDDLSGERKASCRAQAQAAHEAALAPPPAPVAR